MGLDDVVFRVSLAVDLFVVQITGEIPVFMAAGPVHAYFHGRFRHVDS